MPSATTLIPGFDITPYVIFGTGLFAIGCLIWWAAWELINAPILKDPMEEWYGHPELEDTPFLLEQLNARERGIS